MNEDRPTIPAETLDTRMSGVESRPAHKDPEQIGPYRILEKIGEGGMGLVYKAEQRDPVRRIVALKVIKLGMDTKEVVARFEAERQALAMLSHPNVARVFDAGMTERGRPYFAMEHVPGVPLTQYCDESKLPTRARLELFIKVCEAIQHAHHKGIIHRDLKPTNVLVMLVDNKPVPKVIDFGIAKATNQALTQHTLFTQTGALIGTPEYMSPEQAMTSGLDVDTRTDVYALGVMLYQLLTGVLPFDSQQLRTAGMEGMAKMIRETEPPRPSTRLSGVGDNVASVRGDTRLLERELRGDLDWIVLKAIEKDRTRRYESTAALAQDVERHLNNEPVLARPPSTAYRVSKFVRRHRGAVAAAAAVTLALILGIVGTGVGYVRAREQRDKAFKAEATAIEQRKAAEAAREDARNANLFLRDLMMSFGNPNEGKVGVMRAVKRLDEGWLKDDPETQLASRIALGYFFLQQNDATRADHQFDAALAMSRRSDGTVPRELSAAISAGRGMALWMRKDLPEAERYLRQALEDYRTIKGAEGQVVQTMMMLAAIKQAGGDLDKAMQLVREAQQIAATQPAFAAMYGQSATATSPANAKGVELANAGKFTEALAEYVKACALTPSSHWDWYHLSCIHLYLGDEAGYREAAKGMLERFGGTTLAPVGERTAKVCLLSARPVGDMTHLQRMIDHALASAEHPTLQPWFRLTKALAQYRAGEYASAIKYLEDTKELTAPTPNITVEVLRAMCVHRMGDAAKAKEYLERAAARVDEELPKLRKDENWMICHILMREAKSMIERKEQ